MTAKIPIVSIIVRTKDRPKFLRQALKSIVAQSYTNIEVILINDGGCDLDIISLEKLLYPVSLCYIRNETATGRSSAANIALDNVTGQYVGFLDDDDVLLPEHLMILTSFLNKSDYLVAYTNVEEYQKVFDFETQSYTTELINTYNKDFNATELLLYNYIPFNGLLFNVSVLKDERLDNDLDIYEDWDLLIRLSQKYAFYHIDIVSAHYNKWSNDLQINNLNYAATMVANQTLIIKRYMNCIPADFLRQVWSERLSSLFSINLLKKEIDKLNHIIDERQNIINDLQVHRDQITQQKDQIITQQQDSYQSKLQEIYIELDKSNTERNKSNAELENLHDLLDEYLHINGECKRKMDRMKAYHQEEKQLLNNQHSIEKNNFLQQMKHLSEELTHKIDAIQHLENNIFQINNEINNIHTSLAWRLIRRLRKLLVSYFPDGSLRHKRYLSIRHGAGQFLRLFITTKK